jgi:hypothetical protein
MIIAGGEAREWEGRRPRRPIERKYEDSRRDAKEAEKGERLRCRRYRADYPATERRKYSMRCSSGALPSAAERANGGDAVAPAVRL